MVKSTQRFQALREISRRTERRMGRKISKEGKLKKVSEYFGDNVFDINKVEELSGELKSKLKEYISSGKLLPKELADIVGKAAMNWAISRGATHFCHWFQPLTEGTAEKHDSFLCIVDDHPIEELSGAQVVQGEPDASSFPHGGFRSTFEARGYTAWDLSSPMFLMEGPNGKTLYIPTAFVSYLGDALDKKTPLLRSIGQLDKQATKFLQLTGHKDATKVKVTAGSEQEFFLIDKSFFFLRPDLMMTGRSLFGSLAPRNQQLEDHYFGAVEDRVLSFIQELEQELYIMGVPIKTRHNEVAPGQYEVAPIFNDVNLSSDHNQLVMAMAKKVALKHNFVALFHEKPFAGINGSGKHLNWSMADQNNKNLLNPGVNPHENYVFLAVVTVILEAVHRHADMMRASIASHGNDWRLGANEAPPSIISVFLGDTLTAILDNMLQGKSNGNHINAVMDLGANQLAKVSLDNTDRNRTSPFAFTGNKFEFRAVGSASSISQPASILNSAVASVFADSNELLENWIREGKDIKDCLIALIKKWYKSSNDIVYNGDGYSQDWVDEAKRRGLPNLKTTPEALATYKDDKKTEFLFKQNIFSKRELEVHYNVYMERFIKLAKIEAETLRTMVHQYVLPAAFEYKKRLLDLMKDQKALNLNSKVELEIYKTLDGFVNILDQDQQNLIALVYSIWSNESSHYSDEEIAQKVVEELNPLVNRISKYSSLIEEIAPDQIWPLPKFQEMLFVR